MSEKEIIPVRNDRTPQLHDSGLRSGSLIEQSVRSLSRGQTQNLMEKAADEALRLEVKNREQQMDYMLGRKAAEDHVETFSMLDKSGRLTRQSVTTDIKTGAGNMRIESKSGATCFVASVAYDDPNHPDVMLLRWYRDNVLRHSANGRRFIDWYWRCGPRIAKLAAKSAWLRHMSHFFIARIVKLIVKANNKNPEMMAVAKVFYNHASTVKLIELTKFNA